MDTRRHITKHAARNWNLTSYPGVWGVCLRGEDLEKYWDVLLHVRQAQAGYSRAAG
jgi:hypothetical protein